MPTLFISYKRDDKVAVTKIVDRLKKEFYFDVWIDAVSIPGGEDWRAEIRKGIDKADVVLLMLTPDACASVQVKEEVDYAKSVGSKILPLQIKRVTEADQDKLAVAHLNYIDFVSGYDDRGAWEKLLNDLPEVLPRDKRLLNPAFRKLHQDYLRSLFTRYGNVSLSYLLDAAPRESVKLMDVYVPLFLGILLAGEIKDKQLVDWWVMAGERDMPSETRGIEKEIRTKAFPGFTADPATVGLIVEKMREFLAKLVKESGTDLADGEKTLWRIESEEAPALTAHLVVTGDPGSGKSTLMKHLALCLAGDMLPEGEESQADRNRLGFWPLPAYTPIFIELRALIRTAFPNLGDEVTVDKFLTYLRDEQLKPHSIPDYLDDLRDQMRDGDVMFFLDGLDEVPDAETKERREQVKTLVALLRGQFPDCRILVTSRPYAYAGDWQLDGFGRVKMAALDTDRLEELGLRLFRVVLGADGAEAEANAFKSQIEAKVPVKLRRNPLFFTLLAAIWLNNLIKPADQRLPVTQSAIYRECVEMLIKRWTRKDLAKGQSLIDVVGLTQEQLRRLLEMLAFKVHSEQGNRDDAVFASGDIMTLLRRDLQVRLKDYDTLIDGLAQRAGVIYEREPEQFQFAHRSFQEHLAACYLAHPERFPSHVAALARQQPLAWRNVIDLLPDESTRQRQNLWELVKAWLPPKDTPLLTEPDHPDWTLIFYAARMMVDYLPIDDDLQEVYRPRLKPMLTKLIEQGALSAVDRAAVGRLLAEIGDPRYGVGVKDGIPEIDWVDIPAGAFLMGSNDQVDREKPQHEITLSAYRISRYPITYQQFEVFLGADDGFRNPDWWQGLDADEEHKRQPGEQRFKIWNHPRENVSWWDAVAFCRWLSTKLSYEISLPTEAEWEKAARGEGGLIYPYGNEYEATKANTGDTGIGQTSAVGLFPHGASPYGVMDMSGNVWEWCSSQYKPYPFDAADGREDLGGTDARVVRGGSFYFSLVNARAASRYDGYHPGFRRGNVGFRVVCRPPSP